MVDLAFLGIVLILLGFGVIVMAILFSAPGGSETRGGAVVMIGPVPIVLGSDAKWASIAIVLAIVLVVVSLLFYVV